MAPAPRPTAAPHSGSDPGALPSRNREAGRAASGSPPDASVPALAHVARSLPSARAHADPAAALPMVEHGASPLPGNDSAQTSPPAPPLAVGPHPVNPPPALLRKGQETSTGSTQAGPARTIVSARARSRTTAESPGRATVHPPADTTAMRPVLTEHPVVAPVPPPQRATADSGALPRVLPSRGAEPPVAPASLPHPRITSAPVTDTPTTGPEPTRTAPPVPSLVPFPSVPATPAPPNPPMPGPPPMAVDVDALVDKVQHKLLRRLAAERERKGGLP